MKIIDCFIFYNELDLLFYRLSVLNNVVDYFVLVEATKTHAGNDKILYYQENKKRFEKFNHKIIHIIVDDFIIPNIEKGEAWKNENYQRNAIHRGICKLDLVPEDYILISDADEIPDPEMLLRMKISEQVIDIASLNQDFYYYNLNSKRNEIWLYPKLISFAYYSSRINEPNMPHLFRHMNTDKIIRNGGWHLSYFGDVQYIKNKIENFAHQEFNNNIIKSDENIKARIELVEDLYIRPECPMKRISIKDNEYLPPMYDTLLTKFWV
jgi:beta-1,4-mannosyl-glycoprotein beta-1,4-N-acetylglucosaminyltransferase